MAEYIEREAVKKLLGDLHFQNYGNVIIEVMGLPAADVVEVVRCGRCEHEQYCRIAQHLGIDGYCSKGERRV